MEFHVIVVVQSVQEAGFSNCISESGCAIAKARMEGDTSTLYTALAARGQALIMRRSIESEEVLTQMLAMVSQRKKLVPGDELGFLELAYSIGIALGPVAEIVKIVRPYYREQGFIDRGAELAQKLAI